MPVEERSAICRSTNWQQYGENDGRLGVATADRADFFDDCAELGVPVDLAAYQSGREIGLRSYCTLDNGYKRGRAGEDYENVCPPHLEAAFLQGYERGQDERPSSRIYPSFGIGIGSGGHVHSGIGIGVGGFYGGLRDFYYPGFGYRYGRYGYGW